MGSWTLLNSVGDQTALLRNVAFLISLLLFFSDKSSSKSGNDCSIILNTKSMPLPKYSRNYFSLLVLISVTVLYKKQ